MKWGRLTPPKKYRLQGATRAEHYAWPQGFKYPIHDAAHVRAAQSYFARHKIGLPMEARKTIARRINQAKKKFGIGGIPVVPNRGRR